MRKNSIFEEEKNFENFQKFFNFWGLGVLSTEWKKVKNGHFSKCLNRHQIHFNFGQKLCLLGAVPKRFFLLESQSFWRLSKTIFMMVRLDLKSLWECPGVVTGPPLFTSPPPDGSDRQFRHINCLAWFENLLCFLFLETGCRKCPFKDYFLMHWVKSQNFRV